MYLYRTDVVDISCHNRDEENLWQIKFYRLHPSPENGWFIIYKVSCLLRPSASKADINFNPSAI